LTQDGVLSSIHDGPRPAFNPDPNLPVEFKMAKVLYCNDLVPGCKFEARGICEEQVIAEFADHIATVHNMFEISDEILGMINDAIQEEARDRVRFARR
jgi:predicted small metal-binding protein